MRTSSAKIVNSAMHVQKYAPNAVRHAANALPFVPVAASAVIARQFAKTAVPIVPPVPSFALSTMNANIA